MSSSTATKPAEKPPVLNSPTQKSVDRQVSLSKELKRQKRVTIFSQSTLTLFVVLFSVPIVWMLFTSLKPGGQVFSTPPTLIGSDVHWANYKDVFEYIPLGQYMLNSLFISTCGTIIVVVTSLLSAYAFSRLRFRGRDRIFFAFVATLMVPQEVIVIPMFLIMDKWGWIDTFQALILPWAFTAVGAFMLRQSFLQIPQELEDAAKIDGANHVRILGSIMTPIVRPTIAVLTTFTFIGFWNGFLWPLIISGSRATTTAPLGLNGYLGQNGQQWQLVMAASTIVMIPTAILAIFLQRFLIRGIGLTGIAGR
jgi:multiple sugar transport system permease protein